MRRSKRTLVFLVTVFAAIPHYGIVAEASIGPLLRVDPREVVFNSMEEQATIRVFLGDLPLDWQKITHIGIKGSYGRMFIIERSTQQPGTIVLRANPNQLEVGTYELLIRAAGQEAQVTIRAPLTSLKSIIEHESHLQKTTPEDIKLQYGLAKYFGKEELSIQLPESCYLGYILNITLPRYTDRYYCWYVNGDPVLTGLGESSLRLPLKQTGPHSLKVEIRKEATPTVTWEGTLNVLPEPDIHQQLFLNQSVLLNAPEGFRAYIWKVDNEAVGKDKTFRFTPKTLGTVKVVCIASEPIQPENEYAFRQIAWAIECVPAENH